MFRVARLHIGFLQLLEHCAVTLMLARPCVKQARIDILGLCAQESEVVDVRRIEAADEQRTMIVAFSRLMRQKRRILEATVLHAEIGRFLHAFGGRKPFVKILKRQLERSRSDESRVGKECVSTGRSWGLPEN